MFNFNAIGAPKVVLLRFFQACGPNNIIPVIAFLQVRLHGLGTDFAGEAGEVGGCPAQGIDAHEVLLDLQAGQHCLALEKRDCGVKGQVRGNGFLRSRFQFCEVITGGQFEIGAEAPNLAVGLAHLLGQDRFVGAHDKLEPGFACGQDAALTIEDFAPGSGNLDLAEEILFGQVEKILAAHHGEIENSCDKQAQETKPQDGKQGNPVQENGVMVGWFFAFSKHRQVIG